MKSPRSLSPACSVATLARMGVALALAGGALGFSGCSSISVSRNLDAIVAQAPAPVLVTPGRELCSAEAAAAHLVGAQAFIGAGESMEPIYASGTAIVVTPCDFAQLRPGMSVVYVNAEGRGVAHALVQATSHGWVAQGAGNPAPDADLVTARNFVGVITQAFASSDTPQRREIADRLMLKGANTLRGQVALNLSRASTGSIMLASQ